MFNDLIKTSRTGASKLLNKTIVLAYHHL